METQIAKTPFGWKLSFPILFNVPIYSKLQYTEQVIRIETCDEWYWYDFGKNASDDKSKEFFGYNTGNISEKGSGILSSQKNIIQQYCKPFEKMSPYFQEISTVVNDTQPKDINSFIFDGLQYLNSLEYKNLTNETINIIPDGAITINQINSNEFSYKIQVNDNRFLFYHRANGVTQFRLFSKEADDYKLFNNVINGMLWAMDVFNKAYIKQLFPSETIVNGVQWMPIKLDDNDENIQRLINMAGSTFYPISISLLMPLFMYSIVLEKEKKLIEIMKINGMKMKNYWMSNLVFNYILYTVTMFVFYIFGNFVWGLSLFTDTHWLLLLMTFFIWGFCQVGLAFFFQSFISSARSATIIGYMLCLWTTIIAVSLNFSLFDLPEECPIWLMWYPTFAWVRIVYYMTYNCAYTHCIDNLHGLSQELIRCYIILFVMGFVFMLLGIYFYEIIPQEYGVRRNWFFCFNCWRSNKKKKKLKTDEHKDNIINNSISKLIQDDSSEVISSMNEGSMNKWNAKDNIDTNIYKSKPNYDKIDDEDIKQELIKVSEMESEDKANYPLVVHKLTKNYGTKTNNKPSKNSLDNLTISLSNNEIFGWLGPNGSGKTTFFSWLTGIYEPTSGEAWVNGQSIKENIEKVQEQIGYCPQFDLWWDDLSIEDHLYFYSRLKNVETSEIKDNVENILNSVKLLKYKSFLVRELSGGMKRRLTLGISLVGNPSIVFLDEPTTGWDPENKRQIWEILANNKENKCMILTTHLMDEAEILSDRIGIIVHGHWKCLGTQYKLKKIYGKGFKVCINWVPYNMLRPNENNLGRTEEEFIELRKASNIEFIKEIFPLATISEAYKNTLIFEIANEHFDSEALYSKIEERKQKLFISNWAISQVSLEDIFIKLTEHDL